MRYAYQKIRKGDHVHYYNGTRQEFGVVAKKMRHGFLELTDGSILAAIDVRWIERDGVTVAY